MWVRLVLLALLSACAPAATPPSGGPDPAPWFPVGYDASRERFREDCTKFATRPGDFCRAWSLPNGANEDLTIDYGYFPAGGDRLLVLQSGIHGTEGNSGAAVQSWFMNRYLKEMRARHVDVLVIHSMNPWGYRHARRNDETNTNLNRNFFTPGPVPPFNNIWYRQYRDIFEPQGKVDDVGAGSSRISFQFLGGFAGAGFKSGPLNNGLDSGQYDYPEGINYGGRTPRPQTAFLRQSIAPILTHPYRKIWYLDFHTGLGTNGVLSIILGRSPAAKPVADLRQMFGSKQSDGITIVDPRTTPGYFPTYGDVIDFVPTLARNQNEFLAVTMEYGTLGTDPINELRSASRMILDGQKYNFGCATQRICDQIDANTREMFNPSDPVWRRAVMREADLVFTALLERF